MKAVRYLFLILLFTSCKSIKNSTSTSELKNLTPKQLVRKVSNSNSKFKTFQSKAKLKLNNSGKKKSYGVNIRIKKNKAVWLSSAAGIVRALLTKDSIYYYNKLEKNYFISDYKNIENILGLNLTYDMVENLLLSEPIIKIKRSDYNKEMSNKNKSYVFNWDFNAITGLQSNEGSVNLPLDFQGFYKINPYNFKLDLCSFKVKNSSDRFSTYQIVYDNFIKVKNQYFSSTIRIEDSNFASNINDSTIIKATLTNQVNVDLKSIKLNNKFKLPFKIPSNYKKILIDVE